MVTYNQLTNQNQEDITERAKAKPDGVYRFRGILYRVRGGKVTHLATEGRVLQPFGHFNVVMGTYETREQGRSLLLSIN